MYEFWKKCIMNFGGKLTNFVSWIENFKKIMKILKSFCRFEENFNILSKIVTNLKDKYLFNKYFNNFERVEKI